MFEGVRSLQSYNKSKDALVISSDQRAKQKDNLKICYRELDGLLKQFATAGVASEAATHEATFGRKKLYLAYSKSSRLLGAGPCPLPPTFL